MILAKLNSRGVQSYLCVFAMLALTFTLSSASAEIKLNDNLSVSGFLDMSTVTTMGDETETSLSFDQFEMDFHLNYGSVTGQVDIDSTDADQGIKLEQGFVTYTAPKDMLPGVSITAGRFLSSLGFEAAEPIGLYQYSFSEGIPYPGYQNGVAVNVKPMKEAGLYVAFLSSVWDVNETDAGTPGVEAQLALTPIEQITAKVGYALDAMDDDTRTELNAWVSFTQGPLTLAGEFDLLGNWPSEEEVEVTKGEIVVEEGKAVLKTITEKAMMPVIRESGIHYLGMVNLSLADIISVPVAVTLRFSGISLDDEDTSTEFTFSPSYSATDNWLLLAEFKQRLDAEETIIAVESLFTF